MSSNLSHLEPSRLVIFIYVQGAIRAAPERYVDVHNEVG
jgi:hypothetical protein